MSAQTGETQSVGRVRRLSAGDVRQHSFSRAPLSKRGLNEEEVQEFLDGVADHMELLQTELKQVSEENRHLKHAMREWHRQQLGFDAAELLARTQQEIEEQLERSESYSREREEEAGRRYEAIVAEAYQRAEDALATTGRPTAEQPVLGDGVSSPRAEEPESPASSIDAAAQLRVDGLLQALDGLAAHIEAARSTFAQEATAHDDVDGLDDTDR